MWPGISPPRMEAQRILRESEEQYRSLIETSHNGILILDEKFNVIYANNRLCQIIGYNRGELADVDFMGNYRGFPS